mmetsp:Transcript_6744/g.19376  ORF Transcript_6744/g.19376 Transcript_6744/m.19376 type:complete len:530 (+) Transcript_6744:622-2211(+)
MMVGRLCSLPCSVEPQPASAAQIVPQQSRCSLRYARTAPHLLRAVRRIPTSNSRESALKRPDILGPQVSRSKLPQPSDVHRSPMGHSCDRPSSIQRICPASDDATASAHIQVYNLDDDGHDLGGCAPPGPPARPGAPGLALVLTCAGTPRGSAAVLDFVQHARSQGVLTMVALTLPFAFEGPRKAKVTDQLLANLSPAADVVVVMDQNRLGGGRGGAVVTVAQAVSSADRALTTAVHAIAQAVLAPQLLRITAEQELWMNQPGKRGASARSEVLQMMFAQPGHTRLGHASSRLPRRLCQGVEVAGLAQAAADGVRAAADSPFLDGTVPLAAALLCCLVLPPPDVFAPGRCDAQQDYLDQQMAVHAAGVMLTTLTAAHCRDIVVCCHRKPLGAPSAELQVEVSLLVAPPAPTREAAAAARPSRIRWPTWGARSGPRGTAAASHRAGVSPVGKQSSAQWHSSATAAVAGGPPSSHSNRRDAFQQMYNKQRQSRTVDAALCASRSKATSSAHPETQRQEMRLHELLRSIFAP